MKKKYKGIIKGIMLICLSFFLCLDVNAEKCQDSYGEKLVNDKKGTITLSTKSGQFKVFVERMRGQDMIDSNGNTISVVEEYDLNSSEPITILYNPNIIQDITITRVFVGGSCYKDNEAIMGKIRNGESYKEIQDNENASFYVKGEIIYVGVSTKKDQVYNDNYYGVCAYLRNRTWPSEDDKKNYDAMADNIDEDEYLKYAGNISLAYCNNQYVSSNYSANTIAKMISAEITRYKLANNTSNDNQLQKPTGIKKEFNLSTKSGRNEFEKGIQETCPAILPEWYKAGGKYQYTNSSTYYAYNKTTDTKTIGNEKITCEKECSETLLVEYGPPVASIAGLCFEYKVRVKSTVKCTSRATGTPPSPDDYSVCAPTPQCEGKWGTYNQAGPNEEFDSCINSCDNGKYTQSCINKCYNKVYSDGTKTKLSYEVKQMANETSCTIGSAKTATELSQAMLAGDKKETKSEFGYYYRDKNDNNKIKWKAGKYYWTKYSRYYFANSSIAERTYNDDINCVKNGTYYRGDGTWHLYAPDTGGFKVDAGVRTSSNYINDKARWCYSTCYYIGCDNGEPLNNSDVEGDYEADLNEYNEFINTCSAKASCSTKTAEFTIKVNNKTKDKPNEDNWINYDAATLRNTGSAVDINDKSNIILNRSDCYGETIEKNKYMTEWSFPGTWVNNKTGEISYQEKTDKTWHKKTDKFCTSLNSADVNVGWWYYGAMKGLGKSDTESKKNVVTGETMTDEQLKAAVTDYNIKASASDFGHFSWKIDVSCFYALYDTATCTGSDCNPDPECTTGSSCTPDPDPCTEPGCTDVDSAQRYRIRTVDNADLFPSTEGKDTTDPSKTGRTPGFNWTVNATNLKNKNYIIAPSALLTEIQEKERKGETYSDTNLEYEFVLDRTALSAIRKHTTSGNYTNFTGKFTIVNGVSVYNSSLFRGTGSTLDSKYINKTGILGCNNEDNGKCYNYPELVGE